MEQVHPVPLPFLVLLLPHFHKLAMAHPFLFVQLVLCLELLGRGFGPDALLVLAEPEDFWLEQGVLDSLSKVHVLLVIHARVVLHGLLWSNKIILNENKPFTYAVQLHELVHSFDVELARVDLQFVVEHQVGKVLGQLLGLGAHDLEVSLLLLGVFEERLHPAEDALARLRLLFHLLLLLAPSSHFLVAAKR